MNINQTLNNDSLTFKTESYSFLNLFRSFIKRFPIAIKNNKRNHRLIKDSDKANVLYLEISSEKINTLLAQRMICASDVRCLDTNSKKSLQNLCLKTCLYNRKSYKPKPQLLDELSLIDPVF